MEYLKALDLKLFYLLNSGFANGLFDFLAPLPEKGLLIAIVLGSLVLIFGRNARHRVSGFVLLGGYVSGGYALALLKEFFSRPRPCVALADARILFVEPGLSFPSGHSCAAFMAATYLSAVLGGKAWAWLFPAAALVGLSRIYCGVHYPADMLAGAVFGSAFGVLLLAVEKKVRFLFSPSPKNGKA